MTRTVTSPDHLNALLSPSAGLAGFRHVFQVADLQGCQFQDRKVPRPAPHEGWHGVPAVRARYTDLFIHRVFPCQSPAKTIRCFVDHGRHMY